MVRLTVELELPGQEVYALRTALQTVCEEQEGWRLLGIHKSTDPPCPRCGGTMEWDRTLAEYVCHHPA